MKLITEETVNLVYMLEKLKMVLEEPEVPVHSYNDQFTGVSILTVDIVTDNQVKFTIEVNELGGIIYNETTDNEIKAVLDGSENFENEFAMLVKKVIIDAYEFGGINGDDLDVLRIGK